MNCKNPTVMSARQTAICLAKFIAGFHHQIVSSEGTQIFQSPFSMIGEFRDQPISIIFSKHLPIENTEELCEIATSKAGLPTQKQPLLALAFHPGMARALWCCILQ